MNVLSVKGFPPNSLKNIYIILLLVSMYLVPGDGCNSINNLFIYDLEPNSL